MGLEQEVGLSEGPRNVLLSGNIASSALAPPPLCCSQASGIIVGNLKLERGHILSVRVEHFVVSYEIMYAVFQFCSAVLHVCYWNLAIAYHLILVFMVRGVLNSTLTQKVNFWLLAAL